MSICDVGIARIDPDIHVRLGYGRSRQALESSRARREARRSPPPVRSASRFQLSQSRSAWGSEKSLAAVEAFGLVERQGEETFDAGLPEIHLFIECDAARRGRRQPLNR